MSELVLSCGLQLLTQSQRALSNIHTHLSSLDRNALTPFPKAEVQPLMWYKAVHASPLLLPPPSNLTVHLFPNSSEITQGGPADPQLH